jgi:hypothetical protein
MFLEMLYYAASTLLAATFLSSKGKRDTASCQTRSSLNPLWMFLRSVILFILWIVIFFKEVEWRPNIPLFQHSIIPIAERSGAKFIFN